MGGASAELVVVDGRMADTARRLAKVASHLSGSIDELRAPSGEVSSRPAQWAASKGEWRRRKSRELVRKKCGGGSHRSGGLADARGNGEFRPGRALKRAVAVRKSAMPSVSPLSTWVLSPRGEMAHIMKLTSNF
jgi:hypothetical protein